MKRLLNIYFEKLHRYVFDYWYQSTNEDWGKHTPYKKANTNNKLRNLNKNIAWLYNKLCPFFDGWRDNLPLRKKYERYKPLNKK